MKEWHTAPHGPLIGSSMGSSTKAAARQINLGEAANQAIGGYVSPMKGVFPMEYMKLPWKSKERCSQRTLSLWGGDRSAAEFALENLSSSQICVLNLSPSGATNWGQNKLNSGDVVETSGIRIIELATGQYDIRLVDCTGKLLSEQLGVGISEDHYLGFEG